MSVKEFAREYLGSLRRGALDVAFPRSCCLCGLRLYDGIDYVCLYCRAELTTLDLHTLPENAMTDKFWGRLPVARAAALLPYGKGTPAQRFMQLLKYDDRPDIGVKLGAWLGTMLAASPVFGPVDVILPVPLHERKERKRGYNQAERIGAGLAEPLDARCLPRLVRRTRDTKTQTRKSQFERMVNVEEVFSLSPKQGLNRLRGKHVLLVDDVMTTGATLEALGKVVEPCEPASIKIATLALARR